MGSDSLYDSDEGQRGAAFKAPSIVFWGDVEGSSAGVVTREDVAACDPSWSLRSIEGDLEACVEEHDVLGSAGSVDFIFCTRSSDGNLWHPLFELPAEIADILSFSPKGRFEPLFGLPDPTWEVLVASIEGLLSPLSCVRAAEAMFLASFNNRIVVAGDVLAISKSISLNSSPIARFFLSASGIVRETAKKCRARAVAGWGAMESDAVLCFSRVQNLCTTSSVDPCKSLTEPMTGSAII